MTDSPKDELEKLQKLRAELESKLEAMEKDRNTLEEGMQILKEKVAIQELEEKLRKEQDTVAMLTFEKKELEDKIKHPDKISTSKANEKTKAELEDKKDKSGTEKEDQLRTIWKKDEETSESEEEPEDQESKKKLRFF